ncbi:hypothetical protein CcCBS67573_g07099 [Chytriomyces confervae]|uniref:Uncharacterized protein n=1 Tax=Chytriomyces confervae TaxID=246404 RepID=A0A507EZI3_9FUNG|nr:hypothetical protein CcCBS67573_g07099 [Chytriomyces confervae]
MSTTCHFRGFTQTGPSAAHSFTVENDEGVGVSWNKLHVLRSESGLPSPAVSIPEPLGGKVAFVLEGSMLWAVLLDGARSRTLVHPSVVSFAACRLFVTASISDDSTPNHRILQWDLSQFSFSNWTLHSLKPVLLPTPSSLTRIVKICAGYSHYLGLSDRGQLLSWGQNDLRGQLGHGHMNTQEHAPSLVEALDGLAVTDIACGGNHSVVVVDGSIVYTFGSNSHAQLGRSRRHAHALPTALSFDFGDNAIRVACGDRHTVAYSGRSVWGWGDDTWGALGSDATHVQVLDGKRRVVHKPRGLELHLKNCVSNVVCGPWATAVFERSDN